MNKLSGVQDFPDTVATVFSDGTVTWSRSGSITAICGFVGLRRMPFDNLGCQYHFGGKVLERSAMIHYNFLTRARSRGLLLFNGMGVAEGYIQSYSEFEILPEKLSCDYYEGSHGYNFHCEIFLKRASNHYVMFLMLPNMIFAIMSFAQFLLDFQGGERLSYSVTILLILVAQSLVATSFLPVCREALWWVFQWMVF